MGTTVWRIAAANMAEGANRFRVDFYQQYLIPQKPYPIARFFRSVTMRPVNNDNTTDTTTLASLVRRKEIAITWNPGQNTGRAFNKAASGLPTIAYFLAEISGKKSRFGMTLPVEIAVDISKNADSLEFKMDKALNVSFYDEVMGIKLPPQQLTRAVLSPQVFMVELQNRDDIIQIQMDLQAVLGPTGRAGAVQVASADLRGLLSFLNVAALDGGCDKLCPGPQTAGRQFQAQALPMAWGPWVEVAQHVGDVHYSISAEPEGDTVIRSKVRYFKADGQQVEEEFRDSISIQTVGVGTVEVRFVGIPLGSSVKGTINP